MNDREIRAAKVGAVLWDDQVRGLHLRVFPTSKAFYLRYRTKAGQQRRPKLGPYPVLSLQAARNLARERLAVVYGGGDPDKPLAPLQTFESLFLRWESDHAPGMAPASARDYRGICRRHLWRWARRPLQDITEQDARQLHASMRAHPYAANRTLAVARAMFGLAEDWGWMPRGSNPIRFDAFPEEPRERYPTEAEGKRLLAALHQADPFFQGLVWLLALTGARVGEWRLARWEWITERGLELPAAKRKKRGRLVVLSPAARTVLELLPRIEDCPWVFPGQGAQAPLVGIRKMWLQVLHDARIEALQLRDLRRWFASMALSSGTGLDQVGQLLGHTQQQTTRRYAYLMDDARVRAVDGVARALGTLGRTGKRGKGRNRSPA